MKKNTVRRRLVPQGQQPHPRYGLIAITSASLYPQALVINWTATKWGCGQLTVQQNFLRTTNEALPMNEPGYWVFTPQPGVHLDTEAMGPEFVGEVMKAFYWAQERSEFIPECE